MPPLEDLKTPYGASFFMLALNPGCFAGIDVFKKKVDGLIEDCINCPPMEGFERVYFPGELEAMEEEKRSSTGIPVSESELAKFFETLRNYNLEVREDILV